MVGENQASITFPSGIIERLDKFLKSDKAKEMGYSSRPTVILPLLRGFLDENFPITTEIIESEITVIDTYDKRILLNDSEKGTILVQVDENLKLQCFDCKDDPHDNKYVRYILKNKDLWHFLKKNKVKVVKPRTTDKDIPIK